jgi:hypothetical protein
MTSSSNMRILRDDVIMECVNRGLSQQPTGIILERGGGWLALNH